MWTLVYNGTEKTFADWGLANLKRTLRSQKEDDVTFEQSGAPYDGTPLFFYGDTVTIRRAGVNWFVGRVLKTPRTGRGQDENLSYSLAGPWWYLDDLVYQQNWVVYGGGMKFKSRVILGQDEDGNSITSGQAIGDILDFAISAGRPFLKGMIDPSANIPQDECKDITCGDALRKILRWHPDCVAWFDYTTVPYPTLHIRKTADLSSASFDLSAGDVVSSLEINPRDDLRRPCVLIRYEQSGSTDGNPWVNIVDDVYPPGSTGQEIGALHVTIPLHGADVNTLYQKIRVRPLKASVVNDPNNDSDGSIHSYWESVMGIADNSKVSNVTFEEIPGEAGGTYFKRVLTQPDATDVNGFPITIDTTLSNELMEGSITDWMQTDLAVKAQHQTISVCISYTYNGQRFTSQPFSYSLTATDAGTQTYSKTTVRGGEPIPTGLAQSYYESLQTLQFEGVVTLTEGEASGVVKMGQVVNFTNGISAWSTMNALVQQVSEEIDLGTTVVHFGPAKHLDPQQLVAMERALLPGHSGRVGDGANGRALSRTSGKPAGLVGLSYSHPHANSFALPKTPPVASGPFSLMDASDGSGCKVKVNLYSSLFKDTDQATGRLTISGLDAAISVAAGTQIILQITVANLVATAATITTTDTLPDLFQFNGTNHDQLYQINLCIGYVEAADYSANQVFATITDTSSSPTTLTVMQCVTTNLILENRTVNPGYAVLCPMPYHGPFIAP